MDDLTEITLLYVEDEPDLRERVRIVLEMHFQRVLTAANGREGLETYLRERPDVVVSDIMMPVMDGLEMAGKIGEASPETPVVLTTAFTETGFLLKAIELGVSSYVRKPLDCRQLVETINRVATPILQRVELERARQRERAPMEALFGASTAMQQVIRQARLVAETNFSVIIQGETGVGKSHLASLIHGLSRRKNGPFVTVTLGALPESLAESQLFGHTKGAFTGAMTAKAGLFEEADGGTLFLDDVDCAPPAIQAKILHVVEQKRFLPVGSVKPVEVDTRIIAASNRDLLEETRAGSFREDLYYRLGEMAITLPPLRERGEDITTLARRFLVEISLELERVPPRLTPDAVLLLARHQWPGNVRELKSVMKRAALFAGVAVTGEDLARVMTAGDAAAGGGDARVQTLEEMKRQAVRQALEATGGKKMEAARLLDVDYSSFKRMLARFGM